VPLLGRLEQKRCTADPAALGLSAAGTVRCAVRHSAIGDRGICRRAVGIGLEVGFENLSFPGVEAYIRVVTLPNDRRRRRPRDAEKSDAARDSTDNRNLALSRASSVRTLETVDWAAGYLDDPDLAQTACRVIVELAHHRFLRQPNKAHFEPILRKVEATANDKALWNVPKKPGGNVDLAD